MFPTLFTSTTVGTSQSAMKLDTQSEFT